MPIESGYDPIQGIGLIQDITGKIDLVHDPVRGIEGLIQEITDGIDLVQEITGEIDLNLDQEIISVDYTLQGDKFIIFFFNNYIFYYLLFFYFYFTFFYFFLLFTFFFFLLFIFFLFFLIIKNFSQKIFKNFISNNSDSLLKLNYFDFDFKFN